MTRTFDLTEPSSRADGLAAAAASARRGRVVLLPTESVYALVADAFSVAGVAAVRRLKDRPDTAPLPVAVGSLRMLRGVADRLSTTGQTLVEAFWPGPLTIVCRQQPSLAWSACGSGRALTVRMPLHPVALDVVGAVGPSVLIGADAPLDTDPRAGPPAGIDVVLAAGVRSDGGEPSTVVDVRDDPPVLLRAGALSSDRLLAVAPTLRQAEAG